MKTPTPPVLPLSGHRSGYAAQPPPAAPKNPPARPAPQPKAEEPEQIVIPACDDDNPDVTTPLDEDATADDIAAAAGRHSRAAELARNRAGQRRAEAEEILATAQERAEQILAAAEERAAPLKEAAAEADEQAGGLERIARALGTAARVMSGAEEEDAKAAALWAEHRRLTAKAAELAAKAAAEQEQLQRLAARRRDLEAMLAGAAGDDDLAIDLSGKISGIAETEKQVAAAEKRFAADLATARARIAAIDRQKPPLPVPPGCVLPVGSLRFRALCLCDELWPGRPGAARRQPTWYAVTHGLSVPAPVPQQPQGQRRVVSGG